MSNIIVIVLGTLTASFAIAYSVTLYRITKINQAFAKLFISHESLQDFIAKNNVEFKNDSDIHKENFIKFLSDSRDWAFDYIEEVQTGLDKFIKEIEPEMKYLILKIKDNLTLTSKKQNLGILSEKLKKISGNAMGQLGKSKI